MTRKRGSGVPSVVEGDKAVCKKGSEEEERVGEEKNFVLSSQASAFGEEEAGGEGIFLFSPLLPAA